VAAACTLEVSTTVDSGKFHQVFDWLTREGIVPQYPAANSQDWFSKNQFLLKEIKTDFSESLKKEETDEFFLSMFVWYIYQNLSNPFSLKKQIVKYGAPGTGKTFQAQQQTSLLFDIWKEEFANTASITYENQMNKVQFHPSFSYEDFMEGLRPVLDKNGRTQSATTQQKPAGKHNQQAGSSPQTQTAPPAIQARPSSAPSGKNSGHKNNADRPSNPAAQTQTSQTAPGSNQQQQKPQVQSKQTQQPSQAPNKHTPAPQQPQQQQKQQQPQQQQRQQQPQQQQRPQQQPQKQQRPQQPQQQQRQQQPQQQQPAKHQEQKSAPAAKQNPAPANPAQAPSAPAGKKSDKKKDADKNQ
jgi:hypothetical protein